MAYCSQTDLLKMIPASELAQLTAESGDTPDAAVVLAAIAQADGEIDLYLGKRYQVPLAPVPDQVKNLSITMAIHYAFLRRSIVLPARKEQYERALGILKDISQGRAVIEGAAGVEAPGAATDVVEISSQPRVFDRDKMSGW